MAALDAFLRQYGRWIAASALVRVLAVAIAAPALAALPQFAPNAATDERLRYVAVATLVRIAELGRRVAGEARRRTRPAARAKGVPVCVGVAKGHGAAGLTDGVPMCECSAAALTALERVLPAVRLACRWAQLHVASWWEACQGDSSVRRTVTPPVLRPWPGLTMTERSGPALPPCCSHCSGARKSWQRS